MNNKYFIVIMILVFSTNMLMSQSNKEKYFSYAQSVIEKSNLALDTVNFTEKYIEKGHAKKIAKIFLYKKFGRLTTWRERPFHVIEYYNYWVIIGHKHNKNKKGGVFTIIINSKNACVELVSHGK